MKKLLCLLLAVVMVLSLFSCGKDDNNQNSVNNDEDVNKNGNQNQDNGNNDDGNDEDMFAKSYFDYNGKLHVEGAYILNQYNEPVQLNGVNCPFVYSSDPNSGWKNYDRFTLLKEWGFNLLRYGMSVSKEMNQAELDMFCGVVDHMISIGMYVEITAFNDKTTLENTTELAKAKFFLGYMAKRYANCDNIIYAVGNEPQPPATMKQIDDYSTEIINEIKKYKQDAIIAIPTPYGSCEIDNCLESQIDYDNLIYICHCYLSLKSKPYEMYRKIEEVAKSGKVVYLSEWCASTPSASEGYFSASEGNSTAYLINKFKLPNAYYYYFVGGDVVPDDGPNLNKLAMMKRTWWDTQYREDGALTENGRYITNLLLNPVTEVTAVKTEESYTLLNRGAEAKALCWDPTYIGLITKIVFAKEYHEIPDDAVVVWCLSPTGLGDLYAYVTKVDDNNYTMTFVSKEKILFPEDSSYLFSGFYNVETIEFNNIDTSKVKSMDHMFYGCKKLKNINIDTFNTSNVTNMANMFSITESMSSLDLSTFDFSKVTTVEKMFYKCGAKTLILGNADFSKVTNKNKMFYSTIPENIYVKNQTAKDFLLGVDNTITLNVTVQ